VVGGVRGRHKVEEISGGKWGNGEIREYRASGPKVCARTVTKCVGGSIRFTQRNGP